MKKIFVLMVLTFQGISLSFGQVGVNTATPDSTAALDIQSPPGGSDNRGVLFPRMSTVQRTGIVNPAKSLMVFDTTDMLLYYYDGGRWLGLVPKEPIGTSGAGTPLVNGDITLTTGTISAPNLTTTNVQTQTMSATTVVVPGFSNNALVPTGVIVMWSGSPASIPAGWALCDGGGGRPNLLGRFIIGYNPANPDYNTLSNTASPSNTGGSETVTLSKNNLPTHNHTISTASIDGGSISVSGGNHDHSSQGSDIVDTDNGEIIVPDFGGGGQYGMTIGDGAHGHNISGVSGNGTTDGLTATPLDVRPPYYVLAYIIKL
jgi:microcystin-dependent protein